ncbi:Asp-tRNA(Asn)/Glu-tRNA(Gln) amidotransferase subunit GatB [bacterium]|nr:Asp-tRNA(Asn)/Glu-tRNA(Gln) amidotransferase subunit GatB [bacterium]
MREEYFPTIGLEIHIELKTRSKMFCSCKNDSQEKEPNVNICPVCLGHPGTLPVINREAVRKVIKTGIALNCKIAPRSFFERKNYFYPDLPKGYQISQYQKPLCENGFLIIFGKKIRIRRIHLEEDTARLIHPQGADYSLLDFNRAGIPLMELVTEPDMVSAQEAKKFAQELQLILRYLDVSDADMEKGQMRVEANISLSQKSKVLPARQAGKSQKWGTKVEIKNLNSFKAVERAIEYEIERQKEILESGGEVIQETRGWDDKKGKTISQRIKEEAHDYRYFPEPDLPPLEIDAYYLEEIKQEIPELPQEKRIRFLQEYGIAETKIETLINNKELTEYFEKSSSELIRWVEDKNLKNKQGKLLEMLANYLIGDGIGLLKGKPFEEKSYPITPENFAEFITIIEERNLTSRMAKILLEEMFKTGKDPSDILEEKRFVQVSEKSEVKKIAKKIIQDNPKPVQDFLAGKENAIQFLIGQMMKETKGMVDPNKAKEILIKLLKDSKS